MEVEAGEAALVVLLEALARASVVCTFLSVPIPSHNAL